MSEAEGTTQVQSAPAPPAQTQAPVYAGRFNDTVSLEKGIREIRTSMGLPVLPEGNLIGTYFRDAATAEQEYTSLNSIFSKVGKPKETPAATPAAKPVDAPIPSPNLPLNNNPVPEDLDVPTLIQRANLDVDALTEKWGKNGALDDSDYEAIKKAAPAYGRKIVDEIIRGVSARAATTLDKMVDIAGGVESYEAAMQWAGQTFSEDQKKSLRAAVTDSALAANPERALQAFESLMFKFQKAGGGRPAQQRTMVDGTPARSSVPQPFNTVMEYDNAVARQRRGVASQTDLDRINATTDDMLYRMPVR